MNRNFTQPRCLSGDPYEFAVALNSASGLQRDPTFSPLNWAFTGGGDGIRTHGLYIANVALCQLSYTPGETTD
jgi:hypothetical protein